MRTPFDTEARIAVTQATDIARELGHSQVGPDHLVLGLLANLRGPASAALTDHGLRLDTARDLVAAQHVDEPEVAADSDTGPTGSMPATRYDEDRDALRAIGIDLDRVREAARENLGADLTASWGIRPERRRGGRRGDRREHREHREHGRRGRGRRGPRSRRFDGPGFSAGTRAVLRDVRRTTLRDRLADDEHVREGAPGMTGQRLLLALLRCDDSVVSALFATATDLEGLRLRVEAAVTGTPAA
jgi:hypothetical protein